MIRFSAALVAVAIGVLIGGIASSKLLLVYVAIAVSAVALVALAIGVMLKREELFGEGQGHASAQAGATPGSPAQSGESHDQRPNGPLPSPPVQGAAVPPGAAFAERSPAASAQPGMSWAAPAPADAWPQPAAPTAAVPAMWQAPPVPAGATASGWGAPAVSESTAAGDPVAQGTTAPRAWGAPTPPAFTQGAADAPAASSADSAESGAPNWFNPVEKPLSARAAASGSADGWSWSNRDRALPADTETQPADTATSAADEDWPTRYSWLDEEPEETSESGDDKQTAAVAVSAGEPALAGDATVAADVVAPEDNTSEATQAIEALETAGAPSEREPAPELALETAPSATEPDGHAPDPGLVTVVRGVPRFHQEDCVLIRFMPEGDTQQMPVAQAREAGCTPCAACQPEG